ncbi:hypothetical protein D3C75_882640 [compost metagenome]
MPADHAMEAALGALVGQCLLELADVADRALDLVLEPGRQRPVAVAPALAPVVEPAIEGEGELVGRVAEEGQPAVVAGDHVELVAVQDQQAAAVGGQVLGFVDQADVAQHQIRITAQALIVVAGDVDHLGAAPAHVDQPADHVGVALRPVHAAAQLPAVDDVTDQVDPLGGITLEKGIQAFGLAIAGSEMHVGDPQGTHGLLAFGRERLGTGHRRPPTGFPDGAAAPCKRDDRAKAGR